MGKLILGLVLFHTVHLLPVYPDARARLRAQFGENGYRGVFSLVALIGFALIVLGYGAARETPVLLWDPPVWIRHLAATVMLPVFPLLVAAYAKPGRIKGAVRHPMLLAVKLWAVAHLMSNGSLADVLLFGSFLAYAVIDRISVKKRERAGLLAVPTGGPVQNDVVCVVLGLVLYVAFVLWLHRWLIGVQPLPV